MKIIIVMFLLFNTQINAQNIGIGTATPKARLHVADSNVVFSAAGSALVNPGNPPLSGTGRRMMWYADKAAFRVGYTSGTKWDKLSVGNYSFASGSGSIASGTYSIAMGLNNNASGESSLALGLFSSANNDYSFSIGATCLATGYGSSAFGTQAVATGRYASTFGYNNISKAFGGTVVGMFNDASDLPNPNDTASTDRIFQVGNGYFDELIDDEVRRNALTVLRNGSTGIGTTTPAPSALLDISSTTKGFLPPRMDASQRNAIQSPEAGLTIFNTSSKAVEVFNGTAWSTTAHYIGESYGGGIVFYLYDNGQHGLIAAPADQNAGVAIYWFCCQAAGTGAKANGVGAGFKNTLLINGSQSQFLGPVTNAATVCFEYAPTVGGVTYGDWYLPSRHELNLLFLQRTVVGGFANVDYWTSSEIDNSYAYAQNMFYGFPSTPTKATLNRIRAIRGF
ncbi:MAG: hypothetical protein JWQ27_47 [Ferruginibacter sp.]|nr:hypothetical protein [Ferruginibacter sp.]